VKLFFFFLRFVGAGWGVSYLILYVFVLGFGFVELGEFDNQFLFCW